MKLNKIMLTAVMIFGISSVAQADQGSGKVTFTGSIIDAPCSISPNSSDQTVDLGQISKYELKNGGKSNPRNFIIDLENCDLSEGKNKVSLTFTSAGSTTETGLLGITGHAKGASIAITDGAGSLLKLGTKSNPQLLQNGNNTLNFAAYLQGQTAGTGEGAQPVDPVTEGQFQAIADFTLAYQ
ncbi:fimbrial protein [Serratia fonticola]|uniref:fimbrial protein n=1 Tax=Serratia fonticola TaxID=47917 RepID=UPI0015C67E30|nr:fimbrial protein [Serratia fonticola]MBC3378117.1 fimbrial protein [Serratia fonticola]NYA37317.1 fimbrial protein [Serratia fonticola]